MTTFKPGDQVRLDNGTVVTFVRVGQAPDLAIIEFNDRANDRAVVSMAELTLVGKRR